MTILHRTREEAAKVAVEWTFRPSAFDWEIGSVVAKEKIAAAIRSMPLPEATEEEKSALAIHLLGTIGAGMIFFDGREADKMADAVLAWLRSKP